MQELVDAGTIAGAVMLLARHDTLLLLEAVGYADLDERVPMRTGHLFSVASIAKPVTAVGAMILQDRITSYNVCYTKLLRAHDALHARERGGT